MLGRFRLIAMGLACTACVPAEQGVSQGPANEAVIVLSEGDCGAPDVCPVYDLTLHPSGGFALNGRKHVKTTGLSEGGLGEQAWKDAEKVLEDAKFWTLPPRQTHETLTCHGETPLVQVTWRTASGKEKTLKYEAGCGVDATRDLVMKLRGALHFSELVYTDKKFDFDGRPRQQF
jgi:hypothetical protein